MSEPEAITSKLIAIAPLPNGASTPQSEEKPTMPYSCLVCARRKVKCDKLQPECTTCRKTKAECVYQAPPPRKRKRKPEDDIQERLERYERLLKENNLLPDGDAAEQSNGDNAETQESATALLLGDSSGPAATGKLVSRSGKTRYLDSALWKILKSTGEDIPFSPFEEEEEESEQEQSGSTYASPQDSMSAALFDSASSPKSLINFHPTYEYAMRLWGAYIDSVEPILKILHRPTALAVIQRAAASPSSASKSTECLVFAIYHAAVMAMSERDCMEQLGQERSRLLTLYYDTVRYALINVDFLRSTDIQVLQAFVLLLLSVRGRFDPGLFWILSGIAIRMAQRMGLHRDGELIGLGPFDTEVHRRIFWQLPQLDALAGQLCGTGINIEPGSWDTKTPLNINDEDMWPDMKEPPKEHKGATEMILYLARSELGRFYARVKANLGALDKDLKFVEEAEKQIDEVESTIEMKYLRYCDPVDPVHTVTAIGARAALQSSRLRMRLPRAKAGLADERERARLFRIALQIMDHITALHESPALKKFLWHTGSFYMLDCMIWVLSELRKGSPTGESDTAWLKIGAMFVRQVEYDSSLRYSADSAIS